MPDAGGTDLFRCAESAIKTTEWEGGVALDGEDLAEHKPTNNRNGPHVPLKED